jgi:hypothetical protein
MGDPFSKGTVCCAVPTDWTMNAQTVIRKTQAIGWVYENRMVESPRKRRQYTTLEPIATHALAASRSRSRALTFRCLRELRSMGRRVRSIT